MNGGGNMPGDERALLTDIAGKVGKLEAAQEANVRVVGDLAQAVNRLVDKLDKSDDIAREADQRARSAHHRIDDVEDNQKWLWRTVAAAFIVTGVSLIWKGLGH